MNLPSTSLNQLFKSETVSMALAVDNAMVFLITKLFLLINLLTKDFSGKFETHELGNSWSGLEAWRVLASSCMTVQS